MKNAVLGGLMGFFGMPLVAFALSPVEPSSGFLDLCKASVLNEVERNNPDGSRNWDVIDRIATIEAVLDMHEPAYPKTVEGCRSAWEELRTATSLTLNTPTVKVEVLQEAKALESISLHVQEISSLQAFTAFPKLAKLEVSGWNVADYGVDCETCRGTPGFYIRKEASFFGFEKLEFLKSVILFGHDEIDDASRASLEKVHEVQLTPGDWFAEG